MRDSNVNRKRLEELSESSVCLAVCMQCVRAFLGMHMLSESLHYIAYIKQSHLYAWLQLLVAAKCSSKLE